MGTSALRVRVVDADTINVQATVESLHGIVETFESWKNNNGKENERLDFYRSVLNKEINNLEEKADHSLNDTPVIISGMASSNIGMMELPYKKIPFDVFADDLNSRSLNSSDHFKHQTVLISGIRTDDDVMRGEETQLIGCIDEKTREEQLFIFPGTHSKHVIVRQGIVIDFKTYMTGEFFELLSKKSILSNVVERSEDSLDTNNVKSFERGIADSLHSNILHSAFLIRTNHLFQKLSKRENYFYLSGLLIGTELKEAVKYYENIILVSDPPLGKFYEMAFEILNEKNSLLTLRNATKSLLTGQLKIYNKLFRTSDIHTKN